MMINPSTNTYRKFLELLDENQKATLDKITEERKNIFYYSLGIGLLLSFLLLFRLYNLKYTNRSLVCIFFISLISVISLVYMVSPKSDRFIKHIKTDEQKEAWISFRKEIKLKKLVGGVIGMFIYSIMNTL
tara:strand:- start:219 stop:611 length:393 start_codon:yes stop_codon:yes gene_type:complete